MESGGKQFAYMNTTRHPQMRKIAGVAVNTATRCYGIALVQSLPPWDVNGQVGKPHD